MKRKSFHRRCHGVSLIELMIASAVSVIVIVAVLLTFVNSQHSSHRQSLTRQLQENGRHALQIIGQDIRMSGFYGLNTLHATINTAPTDALTGSAANFGCGTAAWAADIRTPLFVSSNANPFSSTCIPELTYTSATDVLVTRHVESNPVPETGIAEGHLYLYTSLTQGVTFRAEADDATNDHVLASVTEKPVQTFKLAANVYYIRPCSVMDGKKCDDGIPTLVRRKLSANSSIVEPLIEFVENMQVTLGVDTTSPADGAIDSYVSPGEVGEWSRVVAARIDILVRSPEKTSGNQNQQTIVLGDQTITPDDGFHRKVFTRTIFLRNPALPVQS